MTQSELRDVRTVSQSMARPDVRERTSMTGWALTLLTVLLLIGIGYWAMNRHQRSESSGCDNYAGRSSRSLGPSAAGDNRAASVLDGIREQPWAALSPASAGLFFCAASMTVYAYAQVSTDGPPLLK
jgi:hypothetical protein